MLKLDSANLLHLPVQSVYWNLLILSLTTQVNKRWWSAISCSIYYIIVHVTAIHLLIMTEAFSSILFYRKSSSILPKTCFIIRELCELHFYFNRKENWWIAAIARDAIAILTAKFFYYINNRENKRVWNVVPKQTFQQIKVVTTKWEYTLGNAPSRPEYFKKRKLLSVSILYWI